MRVTPGSGSKPGKKEDIEGRYFLGQGKGSLGEGVTVKRTDLRDLIRHAGEGKKIPLYVLGLPCPEEEEGETDREEYTLVCVLLEDLPRALPLLQRQLEL